MGGKLRFIKLVDKIGLDYVSEVFNKSRLSKLGNCAALPRQLCCACLSLCCAGGVLALS